MGVKIFTLTTYIFNLIDIETKILNQILSHFEPNFLQELNLHLNFQEGFCFWRKKPNQIANLIFFLSIK
jgi:hypothetical protein